METHWVTCPLCKAKTRLKLLPDTVLKNYPIFCPKCKKEVIINAEHLLAPVVRENKARRLDAAFAIQSFGYSSVLFRRTHMKCCEEKENIEIIKEYDPQPKNKDGSIRWFLYRWDDGKNGVRRLVQCRQCGLIYLVQSYHMNKFSEHKDTLFEDYYDVESIYQADYLNRTCTGLQLEHTLAPAFSYQVNKEKI